MSHIAAHHIQSAVPLCRRKGTLLWKRDPHRSPSTSSYMQIHILPHVHVCILRYTYTIVTGSLVWKGVFSLLWNGAFRESFSWGKRTPFCIVKRDFEEKNPFFTANMGLFSSGLLKVFFSQLWQDSSFFDCDSFVCYGDNSIVWIEKRVSLLCRERSHFLFLYCNRISLLYEKEFEYRISRIWI